MKDINKTNNASYYVKVTIGLLIMLSGMFLPTTEPITRCGMVLIGLFFGLIFMYIALHIVWPNLIAICIFAVYALQVYPSSGSAGLETVAGNIFGGEIPIMLIGIFMLCYTLEESGILYRIAIWFITRKAARKSAWSFTFMLWLAVFAIGLVMDCTPLCVIVIGIAHSVFDILGFKKGDAWPKAIICGIVWIACITYACTPIGHNVPVLFIGMVAATTGIQISLVQYLAVGIPIAALIFILLYVYFRFIVKPDVSAFKNADFGRVEKLKPGKLTKHEKYISIIFVFVLIFMILPSLLKVFDPSNALSSFLIGMSGQGSWAMFVGLALMVIIRPEGKPLLNLDEGFRNLPWGLMFMIGTIVTVAFAMQEETTGVSTWVSGIFGNIFSGMSPFVAVALVTVLCIVLTNILNNVAVGAVFIIVAGAIASSTGINGAVIGIAVTIASQLGYTTAAAFPTIGLATADEYCAPGYVLRHGIAATVISLIICIPLIYPLASFVLK